MFKKGLLSFIFYFLFFIGYTQEPYSISGKVTDIRQLPLEQVKVFLKEENREVYSNMSGNFTINAIKQTSFTLVFQLTAYETQERQYNFKTNSPIIIQLKSTDKTLDEIVVTGSLRETGKDDSPVAIDIVTPKFFQKTSIPNLLEATAFVNGVRPQINCNVCNTGDIHINGMEGPYTLILIDGMPIVSGLSSVYGLSGIPMGMIERIEVAKGPSSSLYGSEAMGGTINVITKKIISAPKLFADYFVTGYNEHNLDLNTKFKIKKINNLFGLNAFLFDKIYDVNNDGFTDITLQKRVSLFNKINIDRKNERELSFATRYVFEDRWGGQTNWNKSFSGGDSIYGESIYTNRLELISKYEWPVKEKIITQLSYNMHRQDSYYGTTRFDAIQNTGFIQTYWDKKLNHKNLLLIGASYKNIFYDDNTIVTKSDSINNKPEINHLSGVFSQLESVLDKLSKHTVLAGIRCDYSPVYKFIPSPRLAYKWSPDYKNIIRLNFGSGFRIVNVFTEDHAALTGSREVVFVNKIKPERSLNATLNYIHKLQVLKKHILNIDFSLFYYYFSNKIIANYDIDPEKVIYDNLNGYATNGGGALNLRLVSNGNFNFTFGLTYTNLQNISIDSVNKTVKSWQINSPKYTGNATVGYKIPKLKTKLDITCNFSGPQRLAVLPNDFRPEFSPWYFLLNAQITKELKSRIELYAGVKNILNFMPQYPLMRPFDPFDKTAYDLNTNPNAYTFDTAYNYAPIQGIRFYLGLRLNLN